MRGGGGSQRDTRGLATSGAYLVVGIAAFIALGSLHAAVANTTERVTDAGDAAREDRDAMAASGVEVTNATYDGTTLTVNATNTGERALRVADTAVLLDGRYVALSAFSARIDGRTDPRTWRPGETLTLETARPSAPDRVKLVAEHGLADVKPTTVS